MAKRRSWIPLTLLAIGLAVRYALNREFGLWVIGIALGMVLAYPLGLYKKNG